MRITYLHTLLPFLVFCLSAQYVATTTVVTSASLNINVSTSIATTSPRFVSYTLDFPPSKKESSIASTSPRFVSFTLDWWPPDKGAPPIGWGHHANVLQIDLNSPKLRALVSALAPSILRIGGTLEKLTEYDIPGQSSCSSTPTSALSLGYNKPCMPAKRWDALHDFAQATNSKIVFGLSYPQMNSRHYPNTDGTWNSSQAEALLRYSAAQNYSQLNTLYGFELGEELSHYQGGTPAFDNYVSAYRKCATLLRQLWNPMKQQSARSNAKPKLLGPSPGMDWPTLATWFPAFLNATQGALDIAVYHSYNQIQNEPERIYYLNTTIPSGNLSNQTGSSPGDTGWQAVAMHKFVQDINAHQKDRKHPLELWLGEMGPHNGGGGNGTMSYTFASSFGYLDTLGTLARLGHKVLARQTLVGGKYELLRCSTGLGNCDFEPHPDYWIALLWTRLMGTAVLEAPMIVRNVSLEPLRFHAHCAASKSDGSVTLAVSNMSQNRTFHFQAPTSLGISRVEYILNGHDVEHAEAGFDAKVLELNGIALYVGNSTKLPELKGRDVKNDLQHPLIIPPVTIGFIVFPDANAKACISQSQGPYTKVVA